MHIVLIIVERGPPIELELSISVGSVAIRSTPDALSLPARRDEVGGDDVRRGKDGQHLEAPEAALQRRLEMGGERGGGGLGRALQQLLQHEPMLGEHAAVLGDAEIAMEEMDDE